MALCRTSRSKVVVTHKDNSNYDAVFEILMRVDPCSIFNCIFASKDWLSVTTNPLFRKDYLSKWDKSTSTSYGIVGLLIHDRDEKKAHSGDQMLPTSHLGRNINSRNLMPPSRVGIFISKSPNGSWLLFGGLHPKRWYVGNCKPGSDNPPTQLPSPPAYYKNSMANVISDGDDDFKVIVARMNDDQSDDNNLRIQTFCSRTRTWEQSTLTCSTPFHLKRAEAALQKKSPVVTHI